MCRSWKSWRGPREHAPRLRRVRAADYYRDQSNRAFVGGTDIAGDIPKMSAVQGLDFSHLGHHGACNRWKSYRSLGGELALGGGLELREMACDMIIASGN